ncbi:MAG: DUF2520 domain-containing protein [Polaribacter sp.]|nr:DUF2520 domain-containing protein [Polaribacter sp.]
MITVAIIGSGNVASHLTNAFLKASDIRLVQVYARNIETIKHLEGKTSISNHLENLCAVDVTIIAVSDDAIQEVSANIKQGLVVHTSGSVAMSALQNSGRKGVFYALQSFTKKQEIDFSTIPFCLEAESVKDLQLLESITNSIGKSVYHINSKQRKKLHLAAVFVNNFTNYMYSIGHSICEENEVPFKILLPLIKETAKKVTLISPKEAQTGPAKRNDQETIAAHLENLNSQQQKIYTLLTKSIQEN